jgi:endonuclease/exonuclease/phosphatase family metal-dependent hydrolase
LQSTHFDDQGSVARERAAALILEAIDFELDSSPRSSCPVFLLGDLNSAVDQAAYKTIATRMYDLRTTSTTTFGHYNTFTGFDGRKVDLSRIDHIFGTTKAGWEGGLYAVEENHYEDGKWLSDHRLVIADVNVGKGLKPKRQES